MEAFDRINKILPNKLQLFRIANLVGMVALIPTRWLMPMDAWDPYWMRILLGLFFGTLSISSFFLPSVRKNYELFLSGGMMLSATWLLVLLLRNDLMWEYQVMFFCFTFTIALVIQRRKSLYYLIGFIFAGSVLLVILCFGNEHKWFFLGAEIYSLATSALVQGWRDIRKGALENKEMWERTLAQEALNATLEAVLVVSPKGEIMYHNDRFQEMWGFEDDFLKNSDPATSLKFALKQLENPEATRMFSELQKSNRKSSEDILKFKDGRVVERKSRPLIINEKVAGRLWYYSDITQKLKEAEEKEKNLAITQAVFDQGNVGILVLDWQYNALAYNQLYLDLWELDEHVLKTGHMGMVLKHNQSMVVNEEVYLESMDAMVNRPHEQKVVVLELKNNKYVERFSKTLRDRQGKVIGQVLFSRDITQKMKARLSLEAAEQKNRNILEAIPDMMFILDGEGTYLDFRVQNPESLIVDENRILGANVADLLPEEGAKRSLETVREVIESGELRIFEYEMDEGEETQTFEVRMVPHQKNQVLAMERNITQRKKSEQELIQRNFELDSFVYRASHDLKAPLNSLMGLINIVRSEEHSPEISTYLQLMDKSVVKLDTFIRNLTEFSRITRLDLQMKEVDFPALLEEVISGLRYMETAATIRSDLDLKIDETFYGDAFHISIVLSNLISNAVKYQNPEKMDSWVKIKIHSHSDKVFIEVRDNGLGIPQKHQERIFELFYRATNRAFGSGLGLYITRNTIHKMNGTIQLESVEGEGTAFLIEIPNCPKVEQEDRVPR